MNIERKLSTTNGINIQIKITVQNKTLNSNGKYLKILFCARVDLNFRIFNSLYNFFGCKMKFGVQHFVSFIKEQLLFFYDTKLWTELQIYYCNFIAINIFSQWCKKNWHRHRWSSFCPMATPVEKVHFLERKNIFFVFVTQLYDFRFDCVSKNCRPKINVFCSYMALTSTIMIYFYNF